MALKPITRQEQIIAGKDLEPITRMEKFLKKYGGSGGGSGGGMPEGEAPYQQLVTDGNGEAVWEDKPFGEEKVVSRNTIFDRIVEVGIQYTLPYSLSRYLNQTVFVTLDSTVHETTVTFNGEVGCYRAYLGDTGIYITEYVTDYKMMRLAGASTNEQHTLKIEVVDEETTIKTIDPKYLPGEVELKWTFNTENDAYEFTNDSYIFLANIANGLASQEQGNNFPEKGMCIYMPLHSEDFMRRKFVLGEIWRNQYGEFVFCFNYLTTNSRDPFFCTLHFVFTGERQFQYEITTKLVNTTPLT